MFFIQCEILGIVCEIRFASYIFGQNPKVENCQYSIIISTTYNT